MAIELLTGSLVIITAMYAVFTYRIMRANERTVQAVREQSENTVRPYLDIGAVTPPNSHMFMLRIANTDGRAPRTSAWNSIETSSSTGRRTERIFERRRRSPRRSSSCHPAASFVSASRLVHSSWAMHSTRP